MVGGGETLQKTHTHTRARGDTTQSRYPVSDCGKKKKRRGKQTLKDGVKCFFKEKKEKTWIPVPFSDGSPSGSPSFRLWVSPPVNKPASQPSWATRGLRQNPERIGGYPTRGARMWTVWAGAAAGVVTPVLLCQRVGEANRHSDITLGSYPTQSTCLTEGRQTKPECVTSTGSCWQNMELIHLYNVYIQNSLSIYKILFPSLYMISFSI